MKTVLVTGGAGFIGSHLVEQYLASGYKVVVVDNLSSGSLQNLDRVVNHEFFCFCNADILDYEKLEAIMREHRPAIINHHAAQKSVPHSMEAPVDDIRTNGIGLLNLIMLTRNFPIENFIYVSSGGALSKEIVGNEKSKESDAPQLKSPYAVTKFAGEQYVKIYAELFHFGYTILRYANVYGPRQMAEGECGVIPIFVNNVLAGRKSILTTYDDMPNGCTRDYVFVDDIVDINMRVSQCCVNDIINIGSGKEVCILDIYKQIEKIFGTNLGIEIRGPREGDVRRSVLDNSHARAKTGWEPGISLEDGLKKLFVAYAPVL